jgi:rubrerythrin
MAAIRAGLSRPALFLSLGRLLFRLSTKGFVPYNPTGRRHCLEALNLSDITRRKERSKGGSFVANILQPADIVDIGIEKEKKRRDFYELAAETFKGNKELADLFTRLRDWEVEHIRKFEQIRDGVRKARYTESYEGEIEAYMDALVDNDLYRAITPERFAELVKTPVDALDRGIGFEKDAILFFSQLSRFLDAKNGEIVDTLIQEERQHIVYLFSMKKEIVKK